MMSSENRFALFGIMLLGHVDFDLTGMLHPVFIPASFTIQVAPDG